MAENKREKIELMCTCDLIIEDELEIARMASAKGVFVLLFDYPWTRIGGNIKRVKNWDQAVKEIRTIEEIKCNE